MKQALFLSRLKKTKEQATDKQAYQKWLLKKDKTEKQELKNLDLFSEAVSKPDRTEMQEKILAKLKERKLSVQNSKSGSKKSSNFKNLTQAVASVNKFKAGRSKSVDRGLKLQKRSNLDQTIDHLNTKSKNLVDSKKSEISKNEGKNSRPNSSKNPKPEKPKKRIQSLDRQFPVKDATLANSHEDRKLGSKEETEEERLMRIELELLEIGRFKVNNWFETISEVVRELGLKFFCPIFYTL